MKVSVITVCKNSSDTIERTIQSVLKQDYYDVEYLIIDGNSNDGTQNIIRKYENELSYWCSEADAGIYDAMNKGIEHATGEIIAILNSDDWYAPQAISKTVSVFKNSNADITYGNMEMVYASGDRHVWHPGQEVKPWEGMPWSHPTVFVKKSLYDECGGFDTSYRIAADYKWLFERWIEGKNFVYIDDVITHFSATGVSSVNTKESWEESIRVRQEIIDLAKESEKILARKSIELICGDDTIFHHAYLAKECLRALGVDENEKVNIVGAGKWGHRVFGFLENSNQVGTIADNSTVKQGTPFSNSSYIVEPISNLRASEELIIVAILSDEARDEVVTQLQKLGIKRWIDLEQFRRTAGKVSLEQKR